MFLYELALELGVRSTSLLDRAHALGMNIDTTAQLTPQQVEQLREVYGKGRSQAVTPPPDVLAQMEALWSVRPGEYAVRVPDLDHEEFLVVARRPA